MQIVEFAPPVRTSRLPDHATFEQGVEPTSASAYSTPSNVDRCVCERMLLRPGLEANQTVGGLVPPAGQPPRAEVHNRAVLILPVPGANHRNRRVVDMQVRGSQYVAANGLP